MGYFMSGEKKKKEQNKKTSQQPSEDDESADCSGSGNDDLPMEEWAY